jgi:hypothetical protein
MSVHDFDFSSWRCIRPRSLFHLTRPADTDAIAFLELSKTDQRQLHGPKGAFDAVADSLTIW